MFKQYIIQTWAQLKQHRLISAITIIATALSIFLIMLVVMMDQVKVAPFSPESNRDRFLHVKFGSITNEKWGVGSTGNGPMSLTTATALYKSLESPEAVSVYCAAPLPMPLSIPGQSLVIADVLETDADFWKVFDFRFTDGKPYDQIAVDAKQPVAVITESLARSLFGSKTDVVGREFLVNYLPCKVIGVVRDVSTLATTAYGQMWMPYGVATGNCTGVGDWENGIMGMVSTTILAKDRSDFPKIREEAKRKQEEYNKIIGEQGYEIIDRNRPYDQEKQSINFGGSHEADVHQARRQKLIIFLILLIVPAVNLSSMTQSRLRQRVSEIGVRRAFGCTRAEIVGQIIMENMIVTLIAGVIGLLLSIAFALIAAASLFAVPYSFTMNEATIDFSILIHPSTFGYALLFCFLLNLLSSGIPALRASRTNIVNALTGK